MKNLYIVINEAEDVLATSTDIDELYNEFGVNNFEKSNYILLETDSQTWKKQREFDKVDNYKEVSDTLIIAKSDNAYGVNIDKMIKKIRDKDVKDEWIEALGLNNYETPVTDEELDLMTTNMEN